MGPWVVKEPQGDGKVIIWNLPRYFGVSDEERANKKVLSIFSGNFETYNEEQRKRS